MLSKMCMFVRPVRFRTTTTSPKTVTPAATAARFRTSITSPEILTTEQRIVRIESELKIESEALERAQLCTNDSDSKSTFRVVWILPESTREYRQRNGVCSRVERVYRVRES